MLPSPTANPMDAIRKPNLEDQTVTPKDMILATQKFRSYFIDEGLRSAFVILSHEAAHHMHCLPIKGIT